MKNKAQEKGDSIEYTNAGDDISSGDIVAFANRIGVAAVDISTGKSGTVELEGVYTLPCVSSDVIAVGDELHYNPSNGNLTKTPSATTKYAGMAVSAAPNTVTSVKCKLGAAGYTYVAP